MENGKNIIIAESSSISRLGLNVLCRESILNPRIYEVSGLSDLYAMLRTRSFDLLILDLFFGDNSNLSLLTELLHFQENLNILIISTASDNIYCNRVLKEGAKGYINKTESNDSFKLAIKRVSNSEYYVSQEHYIQSLKLIEKKEESDNPFDTLSNKEIEIVYYLLDGMSTSAISEKSRLAISTISTYKMRIFHKLNISNLLTLMELASSFELKKNHA